MAQPGSNLLSAFGQSLIPKDLSSLGPKKGRTCPLQSGRVSMLFGFTIGLMGEHCRFLPNCLHAHFHATIHSSKFVRQSVPARRNVTPQLLLGDKSTEPKGQRRCVVEHAPYYCLLPQDIF